MFITINLRICFYHFSPMFIYVSACVFHCIWNRHIVKRNMENRGKVMNGYPKRFALNINSFLFDFLLQNNIHSKVLHSYTTVSSIALSIINDHQIPSWPLNEHFHWFLYLSIYIARWKPQALLVVIWTIENFVVRYKERNLRE